MKALSVSEVYRRVATGEWSPEDGAKLLNAFAELQRVKTDTIVRLLLLAVGALGAALHFFGAAS